MKRLIEEELPLGEFDAVIVDPPYYDAFQHGYGKNTSDTGTQIWVYRAVGKGKTSVKFGDFTPSYPHRAAAGTFKLTVAVR